MSVQTSPSLGGSLRRVLRPVSRVVQGVKRRREQGPFRGYVDGLTDQGIIRGWVVDRRTGKGRQQVGLYAGDTLLEAGYANAMREDVRAVTGGEAECGFHFTLTESLHHKIAETEGQLTVRTLGADRFVIGALKLELDRSDPPVDLDNIGLCRHALKAEIEALLELLEATPATEAPLPLITQPDFTPHQKLFDTAALIPEIPVSGQPAYLDYVRYRYRMDETYQVEPGLEAQDQYLYWYLTAYRAQEKRRVPLSRELLDYLNAPMAMGGQSHTLSRIMWWRLSGRPDLLARTNLNDRDSYMDTLFWWAHQDVTHMYFEDCLVPDRFADTLRGVHPSRRLDAYPLSYFTERYFLDSPRLHFLSPGEAEDRKLLLLCIMIAATLRPDLLRYVPRSNLSKLLEPGTDGPSELEAFVNALVEPETPISLSRARYTAMLRQKHFDLQSYSFMTRDPQGNRFEAAALPAPDDSRPEVDVQLIGPLAKASGLGQATRLSAAILRETDLTIRGVDFDLDNPAPEGFSSDTLIEDYGPAKINMIHLNAESIPLAFAYQPDVFSGKYNIGYFFWELDMPAYCHYLGMDLLDEIWVSTEYGVSIYKPDADGRPVVNVGMCYEELEGIDRPSARRFVNERFKFNDDHYVCLVAFDSFSFVQRKNPVSVLQAFQKAFEGVKNARLVVKTQNRDSVFDPVQVYLWDRVDAIITSDPRIVVMNETLTYRDLLRLKAGSDCYISLHKSEGWGFGMIEAMNLKVPVVCSGYSGNMDFCTEETAWLVDYELVDLQKGDYIFVRPGSQWAEPYVDAAAAQLRAAYEDPAKRQAKAEAAHRFIRDEFSDKAIAKRYGGRLRDILSELRKQKA